MSWPQWSGNNVSSIPAQPVINSAPAVVPPGLQYTQDQWTQLQQQNWNQWAQWQQQYQQWHQQYGAEYQKSLNALAQNQPAMPNVAVPPPLPVESKPPLPTEDPPPGPPYNVMPPQQPPPPQVSNYNTVPPQNQQWSNQNRFNKPNDNFYQNKRPFDQSGEPEAKRQNKSTPPWQTIQPPSLIQQPTQPQQLKPVCKDNLEELTEAEKKFDKQFAEWEAQFNQWKEQNSGHPDKQQYREYEKKWEMWRGQLLERREQMKRKRLGLIQAAAADSINVNKNIAGFSQQPQQQISNQNKVGVGSVGNFNKPALNNSIDDGLKANKSFMPQFPDSDSGLDFLKPMSGGGGGGIPGLDLVKDDPPLPAPKQSNKDVVIIDQEIDKTQQKQAGPDFDAISKGINNILGDKKLLNMLSLVSQNQGLKTNDAVINTTSKIQLDNSFMDQQSNQSFEEQSNQSENFNQREYVNNFDDQTRSSFTQGMENDQNRNRFDGNNSGMENNERAFHNQFGPQRGYPANDKFGRNNNNNANRPFNDVNQFDRGSNDHFNQDRFGDNNGGENNRFEIKQQRNDFNRNNNFGQGNSGPPPPPPPLMDSQQPQRDFGMRNFSGDNSNRPFGNYNNNNRGNYDNNYEEFNSDAYGNDDWSEQQNYNEDFNEEEQQPPPIEEEDNMDDLLEPSTIIDYEHKSVKSTEPEVLIEPIYMFDYRHKPISRIPLPQRPKWLAETVKYIREFDPPVVRSFEMPGVSRRYPGVPPPPLMNNRRGVDRRPGVLMPDLRRPMPNFERSYNEDKSSNFNKNVSNKNNWQFERRYDNKTINKNASGDSDFQKSYDGNATNMDLECDDNISEPDWEDLSENESNKKDFVTASEKTNERANEKNAPTSGSSSNSLSKNVVLIEDILNPPGRNNRPPRIVIILRGPPGSGKTFLAKLIKDREVENGGSTPRILSLDDYFMIEQEKEISEDGKKIKVKDMIYEYEAEMEESYRLSLVKSFKKTITDGYFSFIIVDNINDKVKYFGEMWSFAKQNGFQVYVCQLDLDVHTCSKRNIHGRSEAEIAKCVANWEPTPNHHPILDATSLLQSASICEVEMEEVNSPEIEMGDNDGGDDDDDDGSEDQVARSKWDNFDCSVDNLAKLDGVSKPLRHSRTMEEYLQMDNEWEPINKPTRPGQKRVRWADLEEQKQQEKMRAIGFVVGQTNWDRMMDPTHGGSALTQTKYIERTGRYQK